ncbi:MerR family transcriptional regulator [Desulfosediminicola flagellatus]|uniref:MerR family transcriptional regulator n=1 Tax=Desulfosediminicola flagellatus TaxID=2569541 RepID=UPI0010AD60F6|nr:MerR family transcriptional regulator [Desulfosediminicola flagellatus]
MNVNIPDKLYFKIGEVGKLAEVPTHVLRYWETEFKGIQPKRASSNQRLYRREDVELILKIKVLLHEQGFTIAGARKLIESGQDIPEPIKTSDQSAECLTEALGSIKSELQELRQFLNKTK